MIFKCSFEVKRDSLCDFRGLRVKRLWKKDGKYFIINIEDNPLDFQNLFSLMNSDNKDKYVRLGFKNIHCSVFLFISITFCALIKINMEAN